MNPEPVVLYQGALLVRAGSWTRVCETLEAAGAVIEELAPASGRARRYDVSMPEPAKQKVSFLGVRETQVLERLAKGMSANDIAAELFLSYYTVKTHTRSLFRKLQVGDRAHAVAVGYQRGLLGGE